MSEKRKGPPPPPPDPGRKIVMGGGYSGLGLFLMLLPFVVMALAFVIVSLR